MRYNVDIDGTICIPGKEKVDILKLVPIRERIAKINDLYI